jgi:hypothetical protein
MGKDVNPFHEVLYEDASLVFDGLRFYVLRRVRCLLCHDVLGITVTEPLVAVAMRVEASVAVRVHRPTDTMASAPKVAAPSLAVATVVPLRTQEEEMVMESLKFVVARALIPSSTKTTKVEMDSPATAVLCGWVAKASLVA